MKTTFSRTFSTTIMILFLALILVGTSFQALVEDYLTDSAVTDLQQNSNAIASLASAYCSEGSLLNRDFMVNLDVASRVSGADTIIFGADGRVLLCSDVLTGCILALLAQGYAAPDAARLAVYAHGLAGDIAACEKGRMALVAGDIVDCLPRAWRSLEEECGR